MCVCVCVCVSHDGERDRFERKRSNSARFNRMAAMAVTGEADTTPIEAGVDEKGGGYAVFPKVMVVIAGCPVILHVRPLGVSCVVCSSTNDHSHHSHHSPTYVTAVCTPCSVVGTLAV